MFYLVYLVLLPLPFHKRFPYLPIYNFNFPSYFQLFLVSFISIKLKIPVCGCIWLLFVSTYFIRFYWTLFYWQIYPSSSLPHLWYLEIPTSRRQINKSEGTLTVFCKRRHDLHVKNIFSETSDFYIFGVQRSVMLRHLGKILWNYLGVSNL